MKFCGGCRALEELDDEGKVVACSLGFQIEQMIDTKRQINAKPLEECPRPVTYAQFNRLIKIQ